MQKAYDLVIRGGTIVDGSGGDRFVGDVAVADGRIVAVGTVSGQGAEEIDARGHLVTPGFVDVHTHYDGQASWDERLQPSSWHGVTTVISGNCGVGFAPCKPEDHDRLIRLMEGVEDIPFPVLTEGLPWNWESFPDYLDAIGKRNFDIDIGLQLPHAALRVFVMGERGANREPATPTDINAMAAIAKRAVDAGALGFSTSRTLNHRTSDGQPTPTLTAAEDELMGIAMGLKAAGKGVLQFVSDFANPVEEFAMFRRLCEASGRPLSFSLAQSARAKDGWKTLLGELTAATEAGLEMRAQVAPRAVGVLLGLELTLNPFSLYPGYKDIAGLPIAERAAKLADPAFRAALLSQPPTESHALAANMLARWDDMYALGAEPNYEPTADQSFGVLAKAQGRSPQEVALDAMLDHGGKGMIYVPFLNYADGSLDPSYMMLRHRDTVPGLSDGGAHVGMICDGSFPTSLLTHWTRDRVRGPKLTVEQAVRMQAADTAALIGLHDRGRIHVGLRADINIIDYDNLRLHPPEVAYDLPAGGRRLIQRATGYVATIVAGQVTYRDGEPTGALPGRLVRGAKSAPMAVAAE
ncbi:D-aminoacylase [Polymorphobacter arshaanensis]|uniref:D-aminoacylase n=1 Tax=Glacieibacterium arshaanense TaxID=2511025 RepID=A0A4Y9EQT9_9SPHN|nr:amidohydrolase family protein [Polymorphobacter arshaanensis]TFU05976.1 D-aminoacylase [Polymorphobacter arshaanensis]